MEIDENELTEMVGLKVSRQDGVRTPASGFSFLVQKAAACDCCEDCPGSDCACEDCTHGDCSGNRADAYDAAKDTNSVGGIDETPDIQGAEQVLIALYKLLESEAREGQVGAHEECDVTILSEAISLIQWFKRNEEQGATEDDGNDMAKSVALAELDEFVVAKAHRKFSSDDRKALADKGHALPDGSYPIPDADALRRAAILARSGHGDVAAAKRLIAKRAKELGVANPLADDKSAQKDTEPTETTSETPEVSADTLDRESVSKMIADAVAETVSNVAKERDDARHELEVLKATPTIGGPAIMAPASARHEVAKSEFVAKSAYHKRMAQMPGLERELILYHQAKAAEFAAKANG